MISIKGRYQIPVENGSITEKWWLIDENVENDKKEFSEIESILQSLPTFR